MSMPWYNTSISKGHFLLRYSHINISEVIQIAKQHVKDVNLPDIELVKTTIVASNTSKTVTNTKIRAKTVKKVYSLPGQKHNPPEEEPLRIFYESLSKQIPSSEMAQFWP
ncbi:hypothetical protein ZIOFF_059541 [Zingiber officinale]|uniref:Uncharacterized protein n=1 Tax=Zingiber officinale TaxID=94328 RepID=A0A8J5F9K6_ZINOF|nr:hypothetical protein ZIOFF_059541 [Zingiber officinale]